MDTKDLRGLMEAYSEVHAPQEVEEAVKGASRHDTEMRKASAAERRGGEKRLSPSKGKGYADQQKQQISYMDKLTKKNKNIIVGMTHEEVEEVEEEMKPLPKEKMERQAQRAHGKETRAAAAGDEKETNKQMQRRIAMQDPRSRRTALQNKKMAEEFDIFDTVLEFLQVEGYAETLEEAEWLMANVIDDETIEIILGEEQLDEISQKTAIRAYAARATGEYEYDTNPSDQTKSGKYKSDVAKGRIEKKFGKKAGAHADRAAHAQIFGRKGAGGMPEKP